MAMQKEAEEIRRVPPPVSPTVADADPALLDERPAEPEAVVYGSASQWRLMWMKFRKHRLAVWSAGVVLLMYLLGIFCAFLAPYTLTDSFSQHTFAPPQRLHWVSEEGFHLRPFVYGLTSSRDPQTLAKVYSIDPSQRHPVYLFVDGPAYKMFGLSLDTHLFGVKEGTVFLLGTDSMGRDVFSRILYGARISLTIGLIGVALSFVLGLTLGLISGYYGGWLDNLIQRVIDILRSFPAIPLWMALAAALPETWTPLQVYFGITIVLSLLGWTGLARQVRGKILSLRQEDYALAAKFAGASEWRIMTRHLLPAFFSHIVVVLTLHIPAMILAETALSFLGIGLRPPITSWGVMLKEAQNVQAVAMHPWLLTPTVFVIITVLAFNFVGDGLRDAADPYSD
jgi:peptide/nickel transport system permease protein